ncbi:MAG: VWA domain-containing protein [Saprospiraceae bacterium]|nr:VWA domain-containing protein [Saprospiraceae bacterium]
MIGFRFSAFFEDDKIKAIYDNLLKLFQELLLYTNGNITETLSWMTQIDQQYKITDESYGMADFIQDLIDQGMIEQNENNHFVPSRKSEIALRKKALKDVFGEIKKSKKGNHNTKFNGLGDEPTSNAKPYEYGDPVDKLAMTNSLKNAQINHGIDDFYLLNEDLEVQESLLQSQMSTVLMIDISHSMILYGEDRITPAKRVALALAEYIRSRFPKDTLDIIVFGNDAWQIELKDLPYLEVGPYHTNTVAGLELAMDILKKSRNPNKQIFMITDGKPTCIKKGKKYYKNSYGLDRKIISRTLTLAAICKKIHIPITTFMITDDPYLVSFVEEFTKVNQGKAFYSSLQGLGDYVFRDYKNNKNRRK